MKEESTGPVTLREVAEAAGVSKAAVGYALQNKPGVAAETRERILEIARRMGYSPDARLASFMAKIRSTREKGTLPIAWLNTHCLEDAWQRYQFLAPYFDGASERCSALGFRLEPIWVKRPGLTISQLSRALYQRGIEGVIITHPARHLRLRWEHLASVSLEGALLAPGLDRVMTDTNYNLLMAWKKLRKMGYRRIGVCLAEELDRFSHHLLRITAEYLSRSVPARDRLRPLFHSHHFSDDQRSAEFREWVKSEEPEVIICFDNRLIDWLKAGGIRVPEDCGLVHLATDDDVPTWAGVHSNRRAVGRAAADQVISLVYHRQFGVPAIPLNTLIRGTWQSGKTLGLTVPTSKKRSSRSFKLNVK